MADWLVYLSRLFMYITFVFVCGSLSGQTQASPTIPASPAGYELPFAEYLSRVAGNNFSFLAEKYNVDIAEAEAIAQKILPDPSLEFEAGHETFSLGLAYTLEPGKRRARMRHARSAATLEKLALEYYFTELRAEATHHFLDAILQRELLALRRESYEYMLRLSQSDSIRLATGEITANDARQSRLEAATLLNEVYTQEATFKSSLALLNRYMGVGMAADSLYVLRFPIGHWDELRRDFILADLIAHGLNHRPDLLAAWQQIEVSANEYKLVKSERRPDIGLSVSYERDWHGFLPPSKSVTAGVSVPLTFSNINKGAVNAARLRVEQSAMQQKERELQVQTEISQAFYLFEAENKKVDQYRSGLLDESRKVLDGIVYKYQRGETGILDVLIAQRTYNEVHGQYLETMKGYASALVELEKTCGLWDIKF